MSRNRHAEYIAALPPDWEKVNLEVIGAICSGGTPSREVPAFWGGSKAWVTPGELTGIKGKWLIVTRERITEAGLSASAAVLMPRGTLLVTTRATVGLVAVAAIPVCTNQGFKSIIPNLQACPDFYYHLLGWISPEMLRLASGSTFVEISRRDFSQILVPRPPFPEQQRIAEMLDAVDEAIQQTDVLIGKLKQMRAGLLHDLLTCGLDEHGRLRDPLAHPEQFKDSPVGRIPRAWTLDRLDAVATVDRGKFAHRPRNDPQFYGGAFPFIQTADLAAAEGNLVTEASQWLNDKGRAISREFPAGTIAISIAANIADTGILGQPMCFPDSVVGAIVREPHHVRYIELQIRQAKRALDARAPQSAQKNINLQDLRPLLIRLAPGPEQQCICDVYDAWESRIRTEEAYRSKLKGLKKGLMHDLLTGAVRVASPDGCRDERPS